MVAISNTRVYIENVSSDRMLKDSRIPRYTTASRSGQNNHFQGGPPVALSDRTLTCADCGAEFIFTTGEQEFFNSRGFTNDPKRCQACRSSRRAEMRSGNYDSGPREMHSVVCAQCGNEATVPFRPRGDRPVYCSDCFSQQKNNSF